MSITAQLEHEVAAHRLNFDAAQLIVAGKLDLLRSRLMQDVRAHGLWRRLCRQLWRPFWLPLRPVNGLPLAKNRQRGLYLWGGVGRGKTHLMDLFYGSLSTIPRERQHFYRFMQEIHAQLHAEQHANPLINPLDRVAQRIAQRIRVLCLDEFFVADITDAMILASLIEGLFKYGVTLVTTSNSPPKDLYKEGLQRSRFLPTIDLLQNQMEIVHLDAATDYRLRALETAPTYFDSEAPSVMQHMQQRFDALTTGSSINTQPLEIAGRPIQVICAAPGMVWLDFSAICEGPRSQIDYIELAHIYHTICLSKVPRFGAHNENAAKRFIMLIDELYDRGVKILLSAAARPNELYQGEKLQFEFQRISSRLIEMQTNQYFARPHSP